MGSSRTPPAARRSRPAIICTAHGIVCARAIVVALRRIVVVTPLRLTRGEAIAVTISSSDGTQSFWFRGRVTRAGGESVCAAVSLEPIECESPMDVRWPLAARVTEHQSVPRALPSARLRAASSSRR